MQDPTAALQGPHEHDPATQADSEPHGWECGLRGLGRARGRCAWHGQDTRIGNVPCAKMNGCVQTAPLALRRCGMPAGLPLLPPRPGAVVRHGGPDTTARPQVLSAGLGCWCTVPLSVTWPPMPGDSVSRHSPDGSSQRTGPSELGSVGSDCPGPVLEIRPQAAPATAGQSSDQASQHRL